jgi:hypothetical protein
MSNSVRMRTCSRELCTLHLNGMPMIQSFRVSIPFRIESIVQAITHYIEGEDRDTPLPLKRRGFLGQLAQRRA